MFFGSRGGCNFCNNSIGEPHIGEAKSAEGGVKMVVLMHF